MNIVHRVTLRNLKENKRRTIVTIIGVIISAAMITAVATLVVSFQDLMIRQAIADEGEWHVLFKNIDQDQLEKIEADENTETVILSRDAGYALLEKAENKEKPYIFIKEYNQFGFQKFPVELMEGRLPTKTGEIVIPEHLETEGGVNFAVGDKINVEVGERSVEMDGEGHILDQSEPLYWDDDTLKEKLENTEKKTYKIVGIIKKPIWEYDWSPGYTAISYLDENSVASGVPAHASVIFHNLNSSFHSDVKQLANNAGIREDSIQFNNNLLRYHGVFGDAFMRTFYSLAATIIGVIMVGSVSLIYNAFAISVAERSKYLGMLSSVGATKKQKQNSVYFEGFVISLIGIPLGIIAGITGIGITLAFISSILKNALEVTEDLKVIVTPLPIIIAALLSLLTIFISVYIPAKRASKISAIDAIRQTQDIRLTRKNVKTSKVVRKLFGVEAEIGLKNLKRNKRRYRATVFSLIISIVLFLTVSYFTDNLKKSYDLTIESENYDIGMHLLGENKQEIFDMYEKIVKLEGVTGINLFRRQIFVTQLDVSMVSDQLQEMIKQDNSMLEDGKYPYVVEMYALEEDSLKKFAEQAGFDYRSLTDTDQLNAVIMNREKYQDLDTGKFVETNSINAKVGDSIALYDMAGDDGSKTYMNDIRILRFTDQLPIGISRPYGGMIIMIVSEHTLDQLLAGNEGGVANYQLHLTSKDPLKTEEAIDEINEGNYDLFNIYKSRERDRQITLILEVFIYGFITLITAISTANIFNTLSTSIALRRREFAMLKSVGMTPKSFNKMIYYESIFYGIKSLVWGLPVSFIIMILIYNSLAESFEYSFIVPWKGILVVVISVFIIVGLSMFYSSARVKKENIIDALKQENI